MIKEIKLWNEPMKARGALSGIIVAPLIAIGIMLTTLVVSGEAKAEWFLPERPVLFLYTDLPKDSTICIGGGDELNNNMGIRQTFYRKGAVALVGHHTRRYTHHSCMYGINEKVHDTVGFGIEWTIGDR